MRPKFLTFDVTLSELAPSSPLQAILIFNNLEFPIIGDFTINDKCLLARGCSMSAYKLIIKFCLWYTHISAMQCIIF